MMVSACILGISGLIIFLIILFAGLPVSMSMLFTGFVGICILRSPNAAFNMVGDSLVSMFSSYTMSVAPMFILMGVLASYSGIGSSLINTFNKFIGHKRGGLAIAVQAVCALFGAICGSMPATVATIGGIAYPEMKSRGYKDNLSTASVCAGASLAILIPPSLTFIIYGNATNVSVGKLFVSGIGTGLILMLLYMLTVAIWCKIDPSVAPVAKKSTMKERMEAIKSGGILQIIIVFVIAMGGLFMGLFTPTEAGSVGVFGMLLVTSAVKKMSIKKFVSSLSETISLTAMIYFLMASASVFGKFFSLTRIPYDLATWVSTLDIAPGLILFLITIIYLLLGCVVDANALILLTIPIFFPIVTQTLGYDPVWFGNYIVIIIAMAAMTPPVGINVYIMGGITKTVPLNTIFGGVWPFVGACVAMAIIMISLPKIFIWIPNFLY